jgi:hypothetical protein
MSQSVEEAASEPPAKVKRPSGKRVRTSAVTADKGAIAKGRSINPFAEATSRGH